MRAVERDMTSAVDSVEHSAEQMAVATVALWGLPTADDWADQTAVDSAF